MLHYAFEPSATKRLFWQNKPLHFSIKSEFFDENCFYIRTWQLSRYFIKEKSEMYVDQRSYLIKISHSITIRFLRIFISYNGFSLLYQWTSRQQRDCPESLHINQLGGLNYSCEWSKRTVRSVVRCEYGG